MIILRWKLEPNLIRTTDSLEKTLILEDWRQKEMVTEEEMFGWHHRFNGQELGQTPEDGEGQGRAWSAAAHGVLKRRTRLDNWTKTEPNHEVQVLSVQFSCLVVSDSLWPHGLQHTRFLCPPLSPQVCSNSCPFSQFVSVQFSSVQLLSRVWLFVTQWIVACQASLSITNSWSLFKLMSIELVMPSSHLILFRSLLLLPSIFLSIRVFSDDSVLCIRWPKYWSFSFSISLSNE